MLLNLELLLEKIAKKDQIRIEKMDKSDECPCCKKIVSNYDLHVVQCSR